MVGKKKDENGSTFNYYCYICGMEYNILEDEKKKTEITANMKTMHEDKIIQCGEGLVSWN